MISLALVSINNNGGFWKMKTLFFAVLLLFASGQDGCKSIQQSEALKDARRDELQPTPTPTKQQESTPPEWAEEAITAADGDGFSKRLNPCYLPENPTESEMDGFARNCRANGRSRLPKLPQRPGVQR